MATLAGVGPSQFTRDLTSYIETNLSGQERDNAYRNLSRIENDLIINSNYDPLKSAFRR
jgi:hypothetical protein